RIVCTPGTVGRYRIHGGAGAATDLPADGVVEDFGEIDRFPIRQHTGPAWLAVDESGARGAGEDKIPVADRAKLVHGALEDGISRVERLGIVPEVARDPRFGGRGDHERGAQGDHDKHRQQRNHQCNPSFAARAATSRLSLSRNAYEDGSHRPRFRFRGLISTRTDRAGTESLPLVTRRVIRTLRTRSKSASYLLTLTSSGHHGPSVSCGAVSLTRPPPALPRDAR